MCVARSLLQTSDTATEVVPVKTIGTVVSGKSIRKFDCEATRPAAEILRRMFSRFDKLDVIFLAFLNFT